MMRLIICYSFKKMNIYLQAGVRCICLSLENITNKETGVNPCTGICDNIACGPNSGKFVSVYRPVKDIATENVGMNRYFVFYMSFLAAFYMHVFQDITMESTWHTGPTSGVVFLKHLVDLFLFILNAHLAIKIKKFIMQLYDVFFHPKPE